MKLTITSLIIFTYFLTIFTPTVKAEITTNDNWTMQVDDLSINSNSSHKDEKKVQPKNDSPDDIFKEDNNKGSLTFSISNNLIDYGIISPTNPIFRTSNLSISINSLKNYMLFAYQDHPLSAETKVQIPDSTCDNGSCSQITSALWSNTLTYGFGFRCDSQNKDNCPKDMKDENYYKQFSDSSKKEEYQSIITSKPYQNRNNEIQITYKINTSKNQQPELYSNTITYILSPGY